MALTLSNTFLQIKPPSSKTIPLKKESGVSRNRPQVTCRKKDINPKFFENAKVYCNGELGLTTGGTQEEYVVDVWSGNHPFYLGNQSAVLVDADQVETFRTKFGKLSQIMEIPVLKGEMYSLLSVKPFLLKEERRSRRRNLVNVVGDRM
ncbi:Ribosomal protein L31 [Dillenia turbinata]|uniref:50S ribosomal protein L31 n=1 Tax=Dillenia turbinata TaxID=194707 RepID=A0AAN8VQU7_9MAGN